MFAVEYINFLIFGLFWAYLIKSKKPIISIFIAGLWAFSAFVGIFYFNSDVFRFSAHKIEVIPFLYLFFVVAIFLYPLTRKKFEIKEIYVNDKFTHYLAIFFILIGIIPSIEVFIYFVKSLMTGQFFANAIMYDDIVDGVSNSDIERNMSFIGVKLMHLVAYFNLFMPIVVFYLYSKGKIFLSIAVFTVTMIHPLFAVCNGNRARLVFMSLYYASIFLALRNIFSKELHLRIRKYIIVVTTCLVLIFIGLSVGRFVLGNQYGQVALSDYLFQYTAESQYNFNNQAWHNHTPLMGDYTLWHFKVKLGLQNSDNLNDRRYELSKKTSVPTHIFYSFPGELFLDWGAVGTIIIAIIIAFLFSRIRVKNGRIRMSSLLLFGAYIFLISNSIFYYVYKVYSEFYGATLFIWFLLRLSEDRRFIKKAVSTNKKIAPPDTCEN